MFRMPASKRAEWKHENNGAVKSKLFWRKYNQKAEACFIGMCLFFVGDADNYQQHMLRSSPAFHCRMSSFCKSVQAGGSHLNPSRHIFTGKKTRYPLTCFFSRALLQTNVDLENPKTHRFVHLPNRKPCVFSLCLFRVPISYGLHPVPSKVVPPRYLLTW